MVRRAVLRFRSSVVSKKSFSLGLSLSGCLAYQQELAHIDVPGVNERSTNSERALAPMDERILDR